MDFEIGALAAGINKVGWEAHALVRWSLEGCAAWLAAKLRYKAVRLLQPYYPHFQHAIGGTPGSPAESGRSPGRPSL